MTTAFFCLFIRLDHRQQNEVKDKQDRSRPDDRVNLSRLPAADPDNAIGNESKGDTVGNAVA